jgi:hypothetical protein
MSTETTPQKLIRDAVTAILTAGATAGSLSVQGRVQPRVVQVLPTERLSQRGLPLIIVQRPAIASDESASFNYQHQSYTMEIHVLDRSGPTEDKLDEVTDRIILQANKVMEFLRSPSTSPNWGLAFLHLYKSKVEMSVSPEVAQLANNLVGVAISLTIPITIERGKIWSV